MHPTEITGAELEVTIAADSSVPPTQWELDDAAACYAILWHDRPSGGGGDYAYLLREFTHGLTPEAKRAWVGMVRWLRRDAAEMDAALAHVDRLLTTWQWIALAGWALTGFLLAWLLAR